MRLPPAIRCTGAGGKDHCKLDVDKAPALDQKENIT